MVKCHKYQNTSSTNKIRCISLLIITTMALTACWKVTVVKSGIENPATQITESQPIDSEDKPISKETHEEVTTSKLSQDTDTEIKKEDEGNKKSIKEGSAATDKNTQKPVIAVTTIITTDTGIQYDVSKWNDDKVDSLNILTIAENPDAVAEVISIDENSLDYASHSAIKYRFTEEEEPYFDMVNSKYYLELGWHFANPKDTTLVKEASFKHARQAHNFIRQLMTDEGEKIVFNMLKGQVIKNKNVNSSNNIDSINIVLAKCEFYSCMLVMKKPINSTSLAKVKNKKEDEKEDKKIVSTVEKDTKNSE